jgi:uncharacterized protein (DUF1501 family)
MTLTRRDFLSATTACAGASALGPAWLARAARAARDARVAERVLVVIELRGGNDGLDTSTTACGRRSPSATACTPSTT